MSFSISGLDIVVQVRRADFDLRTLLDAVLDWWPEAIFQDASAEATRPLSSLVAGSERLSTVEFFVYRDEASARSWNQEGRTPANANAMAQFLIQDTAEPELLQITLVVDQLSGETLGLYNAVNSVLE